jgi:hypothetical protein
VTIQEIKTLKEKTSDVKMLEALNLAYAYIKLKNNLIKWRNIKIKLVAKRTYRWLRKSITIIELNQLDAIIHEMKE